MRTALLLAYRLAPPRSRHCQIVAARNADRGGLGRSVTRFTRPMSTGVLQAGKGGKHSELSPDYAAELAGSTGKGWKGASVEELRQWLQEYGVDVSVFGTGKAKAIRDLFDEVEAGETTLLIDERGLTVRLLRVLQLAVVDPRGRVLVEASQTLPDGRLRVRNLLLSEKMLPGETWEEAALRAVGEELASVVPQPAPAPLVALRPDTHSTRFVEQDSPSYPGLRTVYCLESVTGSSDWLPEQEAFETSEPRRDGVLVSRWEWRDQPPAPPF